MQRKRYNPLVSLESPIHTDPPGPPATEHTVDPTDPSDVARASRLDTVLRALMGLGLIGLTVQLIMNPGAVANLAAVASGVVLLAGCRLMARNRHLDLAAWCACATILATLGFMGAIDAAEPYPIWPALLLAAPLTAAAALRPRDVLTVSLATVLTILAAAALNPTLQSASFLVSVLAMYGVIPPLIWLVARPESIAAEPPPIPPPPVTDANPEAASGSADIDPIDPVVRPRSPDNPCDLPRRCRRFCSLKARDWRRALPYKVPSTF